MVSRANREHREGPSFGAPLGPPVITEEEKRRRERERTSKLETKATAEQRAELIEEHEARGIEETAKARRDRQKTEAPKPKPYETVRQPVGGTPAQILQERSEDVGAAIDRAEGVETPAREPAAVETEPTRPLRTPPKRK